MSAQIDWLAVSESLSADSRRLHAEAQDMLKSSKVESAWVNAQLSELMILLANALLRGIQAARDTQKENKQ